MDELLVLEKIGSRIKTLRRKRDLSQEKLSLFSSVDRGFLSRIENGKTNFSIRTLHNICRSLRCSLSKIVC